MKVLLELTVEGKVSLDKIESVIDNSTAQEALAEGLNKTVRLRIVDTDSTNKALLAFIHTIEATGGVRQDKAGFYTPRADHEWIDLGHAYMMACRAIGHKPIAKAIDEDD